MLEQAAKLMPPEKLIQLDNLMKYATTQEKLDEIWEDLRNGLTKLETLRR